MSSPVAFTDIAKSANDLLTKDFYHTQAVKLEVKSKAPNGVNFNVKGTGSHEGSTSGSIEGKYADAASGLTVTQSWSTANVLTTKLELVDNFAKGLKLEGITDFIPSSQKYGAKVNVHFKQPNFHTRLFFDAIKGPVANFDAVLGHEGFLVGAEAGYDVQKAAITRYSTAIGYAAPEYSAAVTATNSLSVFAASYHHKVNSQVEAGAKATWDSKAGNNVGLELAGKYRLDPTSFAKAKVNNRGILAAAYNVKLRPGVTLGLGASYDTKNMNESAHKIGASFEFEG